MSEYLLRFNMEIQDKAANTALDGIQSKVDGINSSLREFNKLLKQSSGLGKLPSGDTSRMVADSVKQTSKSSNIQMPNEIIISGYTDSALNQLRSIMSAVPTKEPEEGKSRGGGNKGGGGRGGSGGGDGGFINTAVGAVSKSLTVVFGALYKVISMTTGELDRMNSLYEDNHTVSSLAINSNGKYVNVTNALADAMYESAKETDWANTKGILLSEAQEAITAAMQSSYNSIITNTKALADLARTNAVTARATGVSTKALTDMTLKYQAMGNTMEDVKKMNTILINVTKKGRLGQEEVNDVVESLSDNMMILNNNYKTVKNGTISASNSSEAFVIALANIAEAGKKTGGDIKGAMRIFTESMQKPLEHVLLLGDSVNETDVDKKFLAMSKNAKYFADKMKTMSPVAIQAVSESIGYSQKELETLANSYTNAEAAAKKYVDQGMSRNDAILKAYKEQNKALEDTKKADKAIEEARGNAARRLQEIQTQAQIAIGQNIAMTLQGMVSVVLQSGELIKGLFDTVWSSSKIIFGNLAIGVYDVCDGIVAGFKYAWAGIKVGWDYMGYSISAGILGIEMGWFKMVSGISRVWDVTMVGIEAGWLWFKKVIYSGLQALMNFLADKVVGKIADMISYLPDWAGGDQATKIEAAAKAMKSVGAGMVGGVEEEMKGAQKRLGDLMSGQAKVYGDEQVEQMRSALDANRKIYEENKKKDLDVKPTAMFGAERAMVGDFIKEAKKENRKGTDQIVNAYGDIKKTIKDQSVNQSQLAKTNNELAKVTTEAASKGAITANILSEVPQKMADNAASTATVVHEIKKSSMAETVIDKKEIKDQSDKVVEVLGDIKTNLSENKLTENTNKILASIRDLLVEISSSSGGLSTNNSGYV
jgi:hypothetical protein